MGTHAADGAHELVVAPELAEVAERLGVPLHVGDRVRFKVIQEGLPDNGPAHRETWPPVGAAPSSPTTSAWPSRSARQFERRFKTRSATRGARSARADPTAVAAAPDIP